MDEERKKGARPPSGLNSQLFRLTSFGLGARSRLHARPCRAAPADDAHDVQLEGVFVVFVLERVEDRAELGEPACVAVVFAYEGVGVAGYDAVEGGGEEGL